MPGFIPITAVQVDIPNTGGSWRDLDLSAYIPAGANGIVGVHLCNVGATGFGYRKKGSTDNRYDRSSGLTLAGVFVGCDTNRFIQYSNGDAAHERLYLLGYTEPPNVVLNTNCVNISPAPLGAWTVVDLSAQCPGAIAVIIEIFNNLPVFHNFGIRMNGSTDNRIGTTYGHNVHDVLVGCDAAQKIECYHDVANVLFYLRGYITSDGAFYQNAIEHTPAAAGGWENFSLGGGRLIQAYRTNNTVHFWLAGIIGHRLASFEVSDDDGNAGIIKKNGALDIRGTVRHSWLFSQIAFPDTIKGRNHPLSRSKV